MRYCLCLLFLVILSCSQIPRDEAELYEKGIYYYQNGYNDLALKTLTPFLEKDSLYISLHTIMSDLYYQKGDKEKAIEVLQKIDTRLSDDTVKNLLLALKLADTIGHRMQERVSFSQYLDDIAAKFALDPALLYALIDVGSDYNSRFNDGEERIGILGLTTGQGLGIGLKISEADILSVGLSYDERYDTAKTLFNSAQYLSSLINKNRFNNKYSNLIDSLTQFIYGDNNRTEELPYLTQDIIEKYQFYRHNNQAQTEAAKKYYSKNDDISFVNGSQYSEDKLAEDEIEYIIDNSEKLLSVTDRKNQGYLYNNIAILCEYIEKIELADDYYRKALIHLPDEPVIVINYAQFLYEMGEYNKVYTLLKYIDMNKYPEAVILAGYSFLIEEKYVELQTLLSLIKKTSIYYTEMLNLKGLAEFAQNNLQQAEETFFEALEEKYSPLIAANYLAVKYQRTFSRQSYLFLTEYSVVSRIHNTGYIWPLAGRRISSGYGWRPNPFNRKWTERLTNLDFHNGLDLPGITGTPVQASAAGEVTVSENFRMGGESIFILHPDGYTTTYLHMHKRFVEVGDRVEQGDIIGLLGNTGFSTGAHLHFGMFSNLGQPINPLLYLPPY